MKTWKITTHSGAIRTMKADNYSAVVERLEAEASIVKKTYDDLNIYSIRLIEKDK